MHVELTRMITAWLEHADYGVNAILPTLPRNKADGGEDEAPPDVAIYNDVDFQVYEGSRVIIVPPSTPSLVVASDMIVRQDVQPVGLRPVEILTVPYHGRSKDTRARGLAALRSDPESQRGTGAALRPAPLAR